ncbi:MAG: NRDE family protein [Xanthomonadales bacterium]|nr:NRDE family protein [Xanthomonadales bacterium]
MALAIAAHPRLPLLADRDEFRVRPSAPAAPWAEDPRILGGRDLLAGGSSLAVRADGRCAAAARPEVAVRAASRWPVSCAARIRPALPPPGGRATSRPGGAASADPGARRGFGTPAPTLPPRGEDGALRLRERRLGHLGGFRSERRFRAADAISSCIPRARRPGSRPLAP